MEVKPDMKLFNNDSKRYDRTDKFLFDYEPNGISFGSKLKVNCQYGRIPLNAICEFSMSFSR